MSDIEKHSLFFIFAEAFTEIDVAVRNQDYARAIALLHEYAELIRGGGLEGVIDPMLMPVVGTAERMG